MTLANTDLCNDGWRVPSKVQIKDSIPGLSISQKGLVTTITFPDKTKKLRPATIQGRRATHCSVSRGKWGWSASVHISYEHAMRKAKADTSWGGNYEIAVLSIPEEFNPDYERVVEIVQNARNLAEKAGATDELLKLLEDSVDKANEDFAENVEGK